MPEKTYLIVLLGGLVFGTGLPAGTMLAADLTPEIKAGRAKAQGCTRCHSRKGLHVLAKRAKAEALISAFITR